MCQACREPSHDSRAGAAALAARADHRRLPAVRLARVLSPLPGHADLHLGITVTVKFYAARVPRFLPGGGEPVAVIRQRDRSDHDYPDIGHIPDTGQQMTWRLWWQHTAMLVEEARASCGYDLAEISRGEAEQIAAGHWPRDAARLPWVASAYPQ